MTGVATTPVTPPGPSRLWNLWGTGSLTQGVGGWEALDRARGLQTTEWVQTPPYQQQFTVVLSGVDAARIVDADAAALRAYGRSVDGKGSPPPLIVLSGPLELPAPWTYWALTDISVDTDAPEEIRNPYGQLLQISYQLTWLEATLANVALGPAAAARARAGK